LSEAETNGADTLNVEQIMKRFGNLWQEIISFENLLIAAQQAQRGKRFRPI
jgi:hypothetical protein